VSLLRVYETRELARDGYPVAWRRCPFCLGAGRVFRPEFGCAIACDACSQRGSIKALVRELAGHRCVRCGHPYRTGAHGTGEWSPCDAGCGHQHRGPLRVLMGGEWVEVKDATPMLWLRDGAQVEAGWRILTVHHLTGEKADCRWWNLAALCQRCHLTIQGRVVMERAFILEHTAWFKPYAAGFYAWKYEGFELSREETLARLDELLALEQLV